MRTAASIDGDRTLANPTTAMSATSSSAKLIHACPPVGGSAWTASSAAACGGRK